MGCQIMRPQMGILVYRLETEVMVFQNRLLASVHHKICSLLFFCFSFLILFLDLGRWNSQSWLILSWIFLIFLIFLGIVECSGWSPVSGINQVGFEVIVILVSANYESLVIFAYIFFYYIFNFVCVFFECLTIYCDSIFECDVDFTRYIGM